MDNHVRSGRVGGLADQSPISHPMKPTFPYSIAPAGSPDKYQIDSTINVIWENVPKKFFSLIKYPVILDNGFLQHAHSRDQKNYLHVRISPPHYFSVSVAPDAPAVEPAACAHDYLYEHSEQIADALGCSVRQILTLADHWFLALMRHYHFRYSSLYFQGVSIFGYAFHRLTSLFSRRFK